MLTVEIDRESGFCHGVTRAINKAEEELAACRILFCLGDIVHNDQECSRLRRLGLQTITHENFMTLGVGARVLLRAHGEPPSTYEEARERGITLLDATCPVVLNLQCRIRAEYEVGKNQIVIFGKRGHAEVVGLVGQTEGNAIVIESLEDAAHLDFSRPISLYSQTTMSLDGCREIADYIREHIHKGVSFTFHDTICRQVANRLPNIRDFALRHDVILFVAGSKSSNGSILFSECKAVNLHSHRVESPSQIQSDWFQEASSVGICGATSTPTWLMEQCRNAIDKLGL